MTLGTQTQFYANILDSKSTYLMHILYKNNSFISRIAKVLSEDKNQSAHLGRIISLYTASTARRGFSQQELLTPLITEFLALCEDQINWKEAEKLIKQSDNLSRRGIHLCLKKLSALKNRALGDISESSESDESSDEENEEEKNVQIIKRTRNSLTLAFSKTVWDERYSDFELPPEFTKIAPTLLNESDLCAV